MNWESELRLAIDAAREGGALLRSAFDREQHILGQPGRDIKLQADRDAERIILDRLASSGYNVLAEESGEHGDLAGDTPFWVVDPLDGTMNFSRQMPLCAVSIALHRGERAELGVVYDFNRGEVFAGVVGEGAWLNEAQMRVSDVTETSRAILSTGFPVNFAYDESGISTFCQRISGFRKTRMFGSAALSLAYVACGRVDAYAEDDIMLWDIAGGLALIEAAGGFVEVMPSRMKWSRRVRCASHRGIWYS